MKTDLPRGPTLPLRSIGLENPKWPDSRDKKGPLSRGPERKSEGSFALCILNPLPRSYVRAPPPGTGRGHSPLALGVEGSGNRLPSIPRKASQWLSVAHLRYTLNVPSMPGLLEVPSVLSAGNSRVWRSSVQTAGGELSRWAMGWGAGQPSRVCKVVSEPRGRSSAPPPPSLACSRALFPPPPSPPRVSRSFKLFE